MRIIARSASRTRNCDFVQCGDRTPPGFFAANRFMGNDGFGHLITTEQSASKASRAAQHLTQAGLSDLVELRQGDAFQTLAAIDGIDLLLLDGWKPLYLPLLRQLEPALSPGCLVIADDVISLSDKLGPYLAYVRDVANGYLSCEISLHDGLELSIR